MEREEVLTGSIIDDNIQLTIVQLCRTCSVRTEVIIDMVEEGIVEPIDRSVTPWRFSSVSLHRIQTTLRLQQDLAINLAGAALALDLLEEVDALRARLRLLEHFTDT